MSIVCLQNFPKASELISRPEARVLQMVAKLETRTGEIPQMAAVVTGFAKALRATLPVLVLPKLPGRALSTTKPS
jgi:hypothetical protein